MKCWQRIFRVKKMDVKIYYHHTDCGKVVYYANYLNFLEEARTEFFESKGISIKELAARGILFVVARQEIDYKAPAFYGDILDINAKIVGLGAAKIEFANEIKNQDNKIISVAKTIMVCVDKDFKPQPLPIGLRKKLENE
jgi:acyl-CoA thioester hydrolase